MDPVTPPAPQGGLLRYLLRLCQPRDGQRVCTGAGTPERSGLILILLYQKMSFSRFTYIGYSPVGNFVPHTALGSQINSCENLYNLVF